MSKRVLGAVVMLLLASVVLGQGKYEPNAEQVKDLKIAQQQVVIAQLERDAAQKEFERAMNALLAEGKKVKEANKWPEWVGFNPLNLVFSGTEPKK